jgi:lauroyl/myristoyl acyltransferase
MASVAERRRRLGRFAVRGVFWRQYLDWSMHNAPDYMRAWFMFFFTIFFFFFAAPARRAIMSNLSAIRPGSWRLVNYARTWKTLYNFAWTIADAAEYKITKSEFGYSLEGEPFLEALASADGAIVLTAHMGNYDLGAAIFAQRFNRQLRMVRAPEPDEQTARHLAASLRQTAEGAVKVSYNTEGTALSFELLYALRGGEIVSIQGDRVTHGVSSTEARLFGRAVQLPDGPFTLAFVTEKPIYPLFIVRAGFHRYKIIAHPPIHCRRSERSREVAVKATLDEWSSILETTIARYPSQWFSLVPTFRE